MAHFITVPDRMDYSYLISRSGQNKLDQDDFFDYGLTSNNVIVLDKYEMAATITVCFEQREKKIHPNWPTRRRPNIVCFVDLYFLSFYAYLYN